MKSWFHIPVGSHFSLANVPFGVISTVSSTSPRIAVAIGNHALDLKAFYHGDGFRNCEGLEREKQKVFLEDTLNSFAALGRKAHQAVRRYLQDVFLQNGPYPGVLQNSSSLQSQALVPLSEVRNHLPLSIGDYTDFFAGRNHARAVGALFRGPDNALNPNYNHLPVAYHGRASSVVVSGTPIHRPRGQVSGTGGPVFKACAKLDMELELGMFVSRGNEAAHPISVDQADEHIFGYVLMNDWSARDIQQWEYVPLGPFNAKNFGTTISPWVVLADALEPFKAAGLPVEVDILDYLKEDKQDNVLDIKLQVSLVTEQGNSTVISTTSSRELLWSWPQMIAHHTVAGCNLRPGDLFGSGTISGTEPGTQGSILEQTLGGKQPLTLSSGESRSFVEDGDTIVIEGYAGSSDGDLVGFGECVGKILAPVS